MYRKILDFSDWQIDNQYDSIPIDVMGSNGIPDSIPQFLKSYYESSCRPFTENSGFVIIARDVTVVLTVFPDFGIRAEYIGRTGSLVGSTYLHHWYKYLSGLYAYGNFRETERGLEIYLHVPPLNEITIDFPCYLYTPSNHFAHWLADDFPSLCSNLPFPDLPIVATPGIPLSNEFLGALQRKLIYLPINSSNSIVYFRLKTALIPCPPPFQIRHSLVRKKLAPNASKGHSTIFLRKTSGHQRLLLTSSNIDSLVSRGVIVLDPLKVPFAALKKYLACARTLITPMGGEWANAYLSDADLAFLYPDFLDDGQRIDAHLTSWCVPASLPNVKFIPCVTESFDNSDPEGSVKFHLPNAIFDQVDLLT